jgi:hypothetical protein
MINFARKVFILCGIVFGLAAFSAIIEQILQKSVSIII